MNEPSHQSASSYVGLDVHKDTIDIAVAKRRRISRTPSASAAIGERRSRK
jgi:hypothetical protein